MLARPTRPARATDARWVSLPSPNSESGVSHPLPEGSGAAMYGTTFGRASRRSMAKGAHQAYRPESHDDTHTSPAVLGRAPPARRAILDTGGRARGGRARAGMGSLSAGADVRRRRTQTVGVLSGLTAGAWLGAAEAPTKLVVAGLSPILVSFCM